MDIGEIVREIEFVPDIVTVPIEEPAHATPERVPEPAGPGAPNSS
jgi:hypothetical protein